MSTAATVRVRDDGKYSPNWDRFILGTFARIVQQDEDSAGRFMPYSEFMTYVIEFFTDGDHVDSSPINSLRTLTSRAVHRLTRKGYLRGWYREWVANDGAEGEFGCNSGKYPWSEEANRMRYSYLDLTEDGWNYCMDQGWITRPQYEETE